MKKRVFTFCLAILMIAASVAGCTQSPGGTTASPSSTATSAADAGSNEPAKTFDVNVVEEFSVLALGGLSYDLSDMNDEVGQVITEKTGVKLIFDFPVGDWNEKLALVVAGGDYPDIIINKDNAMGTLVEAGVLVGIRDKIENSPTIMNYLGEYSKRLTYSVEDPEFYGFGAANMLDDPRPDYYWSPAFAVQLDAAKAAGYPEIKTLQEYEKVITDYIAANPTINGQPAIGISLIAADGWRWKISVTNPAFIVSGKSDDGEWYIDPTTYKASFHYKDPQEKEYFRWLNHMNDIGLLDPESFTQSYDAYQAKVASGRVVGLIDALWEYDVARKQASETVGHERDFIPYPVLQDPANMTWSVDRPSGYVTAGGFMLTTACKNIDKMVNFFEFMCSEEGQILKKWGIEGVHYDMVDGKRVFKPDVKAEKMDPDKFLDFRKRTGIGRYGESYMYTYGFGWVTSNGQMLDDYDEMETWDSYTSTQQEALNAYGVRGFNQRFPAPSSIPQSPWGAAWTMPIGQSEEAKVIMGKAEEITLQAVARAVLASPENFDAEWDKFMSEIDAINIGVLEDEVTALVAERMELWK